ncbi:MAG: hypothetical protein MSS92_10645 [Lachnospiraceae bacterium]|nr:hypothetical protein [Lachnospiraceae bacterium]MCI7596656.1 hypothetical protein [Lachnospiraceae bacterium]MDY3224057.1 hypothetical protein [Lachnospiraceae bacterium]MDY4096189.1 hypothetical protein [Lachnospiraceae bacterium]
MTQDDQWMQDKELENIPSFKLEFLQQMLFESKKHSGKELFPFFMSLAAKSRSQNIHFTQEELDTIVPVLKKYASEEEIKKMNQAITMFKRRST